MEGAGIASRPTTWCPRSGCLADVGPGTDAAGRPSRMPKNSFSLRLLKKVQLQGGAPGTHRRWAPIGMGTRQMGLFQQPASGSRVPRHPGRRRLDPSARRASAGSRRGPGR